jgi:acetyl-CoA carboxylase biotin carboxyl carrier protein
VGEEAAATEIGELVFRSPTSGRFYARPSPDEAPYVQVGEIISAGHTICLLEVMKTFNRVTYGGEGLPQRAEVLAVLPADGDDIDSGQTILGLRNAD